MFDSPLRDYRCKPPLPHEIDELFGTLCALKTPPKESSSEIVANAFLRLLDEAEENGESRPIAPRERHVAEKLASNLQRLVSTLWRQSGDRDAPLCIVRDGRVHETQSGSNIYILAQVRDVHARSLLPCPETGGFEVLNEGCAMVNAYFGASEDSVMVFPLLCPVAWRESREHLRRFLPACESGSRYHSWYGSHVRGLFERVCQKQGIERGAVELVDGKIAGNEVLLQFEPAPDLPEHARFRIEAKYIPHWGVVRVMAVQSCP